MGNAISVTELRDDLVSAYKQELDWNTKEILQPYKKMFDRRKVLFCFVLFSHNPKTKNNYKWYKKIGASRDSRA